LINGYIPIIFTLLGHLLQIYRKNGSNELELIVNTKRVDLYYKHYI